MQLLFKELRGRNSELCIASKLAEITLLNEKNHKCLEGSYVNVNQNYGKVTRFQSPNDFNVGTSSMMS